jgi:versiconal hemiacetal acetate reductase
MGCHRHNILPLTPGNRRLGNSGLKISRIVFGGMSFGDKNWQQWIRTEEEGLPVLKYAFDRGINTWDVADTYSNGESERIIGKAIKKYAIPRAKLVLMTKCYMYVDPDGGAVNPSRSLTNDGDAVNLVGLSRKHIFEAVDSSIERLGTYIDVLQIHRLDRDVPPEEIMKALNDIVESGKVRYIGASTVSCVPSSPPNLHSSKLTAPIRWLPGNSSASRTLPRRMAGTSSSRCKACTIF